MSRFLVKLFAFLLLFLSSYTALCLMTGMFRLESLIPNIGSNRGGYGYSLQRFLEAETVGPVDLVFTGSSHAYRGFDTSFFRDHGYSCFNMGSPNQTPMNAFFLLKRRLDKLRPKILVVEGYWATLELEPIEATVDLVSNCEPSLEMAHMVLLTGDPRSINSFVASIGTHWRRPLAKSRQRRFKTDEYVPGGFVRTSETNLAYPKDHPDWGREPEESEPLARQLNYLEKIILQCQSRGTEVVLVRAPVPRELLRTVINYQKSVEPVVQLAEKYDCPFWDFNDDVEDYDSQTDFFDAHHLSQDGVTKFNGRLLRRLEERNEEAGEDAHSDA